MAVYNQLDVRNLKYHGSKINKFRIIKKSNFVYTVQYKKCLYWDTKLFKVDVWHSAEDGGTYPEYCENLLFASEEEAIQYVSKSTRKIIKFRKPKNLIIKPYNEYNPLEIRSNLQTILGNTQVLQEAKLIRDMLFVPTMTLRFLRTDDYVWSHNIRFLTDKYTLQQLFVDTQGDTEWRDVEIVEEESINKHKN